MMPGTHVCKGTPEGLSLAFAGGTVWELMADGVVLVEVDWCPFCGLKLTPARERNIVHLNDGAAYLCRSRVGKWSGSGNDDVTRVTCKACLRRLERARVMDLQR